MHQVFITHISCTYICRHASFQDVQSSLSHLLRHALIILFLRKPWKRKRQKQVGESLWRVFKDFSYFFWLNWSWLEWEWRMLKEGGMRYDDFGCVACARNHDQLFSPSSTYSTIHHPNYLSSLDDQEKDDKWC